MFIARLDAKNLSTPALARHLGLSESYLFNIRGGRLPSEETRKRIASALDCTEDELFPVFG